MKNLGFILIMAAMLFAVPKAGAQSSMISANTHAIIKTLDTVTNTGTKTMTSARVGGSWNTVTISAKTTNLTGTQSGILRLYGSLDGVVYHRITAASLRGNSVAPVDSLVVDVNHLQKAWIIEKSPFQFYQVQATGIGTVTFTVFGNYVAH